MFSDTCINMMRAICFLSPKVRTTFSSAHCFKLTDGHKNVGHKYRYYNYTGFNIVLVTPGGLLTVVEKDEHNPAGEHKGMFLVYETMDGFKSEITVHHPSELTGEGHFTAQSEFARGINDKVRKSRLVTTINGSDILEAEDGILLPASFVTVHKHSNSKKYTNLAVAQRFTIENNKCGSGIQFSFISKDKQSTLYIVCANEIMAIKSARRNVKEDLIEVYKTEPDGTVMLDKIVTLSDAIKEGFNGTAVFRNEADALVYQERLVGAVAKYDSSVEEIKRLKLSLEAEKESHAVTRRKNLEDDARAKSTLWSKTAAVFSSIFSLFNTAWSMFRGIFN